MCVSFFYFGYIIATFAIMRNLLELVVICMACILTISACQKQYKIEERARHQLPVSLNDELQVSFPGSFDPAVEYIKTVYVNDSICMLQFTARFKDGNGAPKVCDYRYIYLIDILQSRMMHQAIFCEQFKKILCMPDRLIRECRKEIAASGESVYESAIGGTLPVRDPFDK